ncbi:hypothetical protein B0T14DRAFT_198475 [Immersiella caudata]|uniref:F-box domain-containing protein n=1 Tax=Immersiella caudata TaxID=314043 RepID=A0AA39WP29_9PEZI|nr:hypothetical protein B0T14DRAFT_198475 [Immersiella caudata]
MTMFGVLPHRLAAIRPVRDASNPPVRLDALPTEIHALIFEHLTPQLPAFDSATPRLQDVERRRDTTKWEGDYHERVSLLRDMRLVSSKIRDVVTPVLLKSVILSSRRRFVMFLRFLLEAPRNGVHLRNLAVFFTLNDEHVSERLVQRIARMLDPRAFNAGRCEVADAFTREFNRMLSDPGDRWCSPDIAEFSLLWMIRTAPALVQLSLQIPLNPNVPRSSVGLHDTLRSHKRIWDALDRVNELEESGEMKTKWPELKRLQLRPDPEEHVHRQIEHRTHEPRQTEILNYRLAPHKRLLEAFPSLHTLQLASCGEVAMVGVIAAGYVHEGIEHIRLHDTVEGPRAISQLLSPEVTPRLRTIYVRQRPKQLFAADDLFASDLEKEGQQLNLNKALALRADSLRELHLIFDYTFEYQYYVGPGKRLTCLPSLHRLQRLTIQLQLLFGHPNKLDHEPDLGALLPPSLVELTIRDDWAIDAIAREQRRRTQLGYPNRNLIHEVEGKFPNTVTDIDSYFCSFSNHKPYRTTIQNMLLRLASTARYSGVNGHEGFLHLKTVTFQVLPSKVYRMDGGAADRTPALQPMDQDLFQDPRRGFFTDPPRWVPLLGKDMWPKEHSELLDAVEGFFVEVRRAFKEADIEFDWEGDASVWLEALRKAAVVDNGKQEESAFLERGKDEDDEDVDGEDGSGAGKKRRVARRMARFIKKSKSVSLKRGVGR